MGFYRIFNSTDGFFTKKIVLYSEYAQSGIGTCTLAYSAICSLLARAHV